MNRVNIRRPQKNAMRVAELREINTKNIVAKGKFSEKIQILKFKASSGTLSD